MSGEKWEQRLNEALGYIRNQRQQIEQLRTRVTRLESALDHCLGNDDGTWLWKNRVERMDPLVPIFDSLRAGFHLARYEFAAGYARERDVADVACGTGYGCRTMAEKGKSRSVHGFDICSDAVGYASRRYADEHVRFSVAPADRLPVPDSSFDLVTSFETIEHVANENEVVGEFARVLRIGGMLICSTPNQWPLSIAPFHTREYDCDSFRELLAQHFEVTAMYNQNSGTDWIYNRNQPAGVVPTTADNCGSAECFIAVCERTR